MPGTDAPTRHLVRRYGSHADEIRALVAFDPTLGEPLVPGLPYLRAEAVYAVRHEMATTLDDILLRRTRAHLLDRGRVARGGTGRRRPAGRRTRLGRGDDGRQLEHYRALCAAEETAGDHVANATH